MDDFDAVALLVRQAYGIPDYDARNKIRKGWGFLERETTEEKARQIGGALGELVLVIEKSKLRTPDDPITMLGFSAEPEGLIPHWQNPQEPQRLVPWSDLVLVAAGGFSEEFIRHETGAGNDPKMGKMLIGLGVFAVTGIPPGLFEKKEKKNPQPVKAKRVITFGCLLTKQGEQFVFSPEHFDFGGLGANKQLNATGNFRALIAEMKNRSQARLNYGARIMHGNQSLTFANYTGLHDFETEVLWAFNTMA